MQRKFNFNKAIIGLDGEPLTDVNGEVTLGKVLAPVLARQTQGDALKHLTWAMAIHKNEDLALDKSDINALKEIIKTDNQMTALVKAPLLELLDNEKGGAE